MLAGVVLNAALIGLGLVIYPTTLSASADGLAGAGGVVLLLAVYGLVAFFGIPLTQRKDSRILRSAIIFGLIAGGIFVSEMLLEYLMLPSDNTTMGLIEFGTVFVLWLIAGMRVARQTGSTRRGALAAIWTAVISSLIWFSALLIISYAFRGTPQQAQVFRAEGSYQDFARSGMTDLDAFTMQDFLGAGFFHLLLGPLAAGILGTLGGLIGAGIRRLQRVPSITQ